MANKKSQALRAKDDRFVSLGNGVFGGFKRGTPNGPERVAKKRDRSLGSCGVKRAG